MTVRRPQIFQVYAALGKIDTGATVQEIMNRTQLNQRMVINYLKELQASGAVVESQQRYFATLEKADAIQVKDRDSLAELIRHVTSDIQRKRQSLVDDPLNYNFYSAFSVRKDQLPQIKKRIQESIIDILDEFQDDEGNQVSQVFVSLYRGPFESDQQG